MVELEIVKRTYSHLLIYAIIGILILLLLANLASGIVNGTEDYGSEFLVQLAIIAFLLVVAFGVIPNLRLKKHISDGTLKLEIEGIEIKRAGNIQRFSITEIDNLRIRKCGYNGQHRLGEARELGQGALYPAIRPMDGLGNKLEVRKDNMRIKIEFYIESIDQNNKIGELGKLWEQKYNQIRLNYIR